MTPENADAKRDVAALLTAVIAGDVTAMFALIEQIEEPRMVLAGLAGFLVDLLPQFADVAGIDDLAGTWAGVAAAMTLELATHEGT